MQDLIITLVQAVLAWEDRDASLSRFDALLRELVDPTDLIVLPEMFTTGFTMNPENIAEEMEGPSMEWMKTKAAATGCVICGSVVIREDGKYYNRFIWMRPDGSYVHYDKKHLFRMGEEHLHYTPGKEKLIVEIKGWRVIPLVCYDLRFPVWSKNLYTQGQYAYDLLIYVANWPAERSTAWKTLIAARAIENMAYAAGLNRTGRDGRGYEYSGDSRIVGPDGNILASAAPGHEGMITCRLQAPPLSQLRSRLGVGNDWDNFTIS